MPGRTCLLRQRVQCHHAEREANIKARRPGAETPYTDRAIAHAGSLPPLVPPPYPGESATPPPCPSIVYLLPSFGVCGGIRIVVEQANRLADRGHAVTLVTMDGSMPPPDWIEVRCHVRSLDHARRSGLWGAADILVATHWSTAGAVAEGGHDGSRRHYFIQARETNFYAPDAPEREQVEATYRLPVTPIATSKWIKRFLEAEFGHEDVPTLLNGVNHDLFFPEPGHFPRTPGVFRVLITGHELIPVKNLSDAFAVTEELKRRGMPIEVWSFSQVPHAYPADRFFLNPSQETIRRLYSDADVLLVTSKAEGRPLPPVEAMACGCPVVSTDMLGTDDLEGYAAIRPVGDIAGLADAVERLLDDPEYARWIADKAREHAVRDLNWDRAVDDLEAILGLTPLAQVSRGSITVIVPTHDRPHLVTRALDSLLAQTRPDWSCLIVTNALSDEDRPKYDETLAPYLADPRITRLDKTEGGIPQAINAGFGATQGDYVAVLEDDDTWEPGFLELMARPLDRHPSLGMTFCGLAEDHSGTAVKSHHIEPVPEFDWAKLQQGNGICWPMVLLRRSVIVGQLGGIDEQAGGCCDWDTWLRLGRVTRVARVHHTLATHYWHAGNFSTSARQLPGVDYVRAKLARPAVAHRATPTEALALARRARQCVHRVPCGCNAVDCTIHGRGPASRCLDCGDRSPHPDVVRLEPIPAVGILPRAGA